MTMTVRQLIVKLSKMPPAAKVVMADHDHDFESGEYSGPVRVVYEASLAMKAKGYDVVLAA